MALITEATVLTLVSTFKDKIIETCEDIKKEVGFFLDDGLIDYLNSIKDKFQFTKTFLYRQENINFYDIFFPVSININRGTKAVTSCDNLFQETNFVSIVGTAGSGKTMLMKHFFLESIQTCYKIPLFIELRNLNDFDGSFTEMIYDVILNNRLSPDQKILERLLDSGNFILLLDGYDEIYSDKKISVTNDLDKFIDRYSKNNYIISSRPGSGIGSMPRFNNYPVMPLNSIEIENFTDLVLKGTEDEGLSYKIKAVIKKPENKDYANFLSSPLLLSMFILTFRQYPELPKKKSKFYWNVFDTLATKHDSFTKKAGYQHERKTNLQNEEFEKILQWFSYLSLFEGKISFDAEYLSKTLGRVKSQLALDFDVNVLIEDLTVALSILILDGVEHKFPHKSLQEYFSIILIKDLESGMKQKVYQDRFKRHAFRSNEGSANLWTLALEVDSVAFKKYFLLYYLKEFMLSFANLEGISKLKQVYTLWDIKEAYLGDGKNSYIFDQGHIFNSTFSLYHSILVFMNIYSMPFEDIISYTSMSKPEEFTTYMDSIADDPNNWESFEDENTNQTEGGYYFPAKYHWSGKLEKLIIDAGTLEKFLQMLNAIEQTILRLEQEITDGDSASVNLLGI